MFDHYIWTEEERRQRALLRDSLERHDRNQSRSPSDPEEGLAPFTWMVIGAVLASMFFIGYYSPNSAFEYDMFSEDGKLIRDK